MMDYVQLPQHLRCEEWRVLSIFWTKLSAPVLRERLCIYICIKSEPL